MCVYVCVGLLKKKPVRLNVTQALTFISCHTMNKFIGLMQTTLDHIKYVAAPALYMMNVT